MCKLFEKLKKVIRNTNAESKMELASITEELTEAEKKEMKAFKKELQQENKPFEKHNCCNIF
jgi:hypothetical protein